MGNKKRRRLPIGESKVRFYVRDLQEDYDMKKETRLRDFQSIPDSPMDNRFKLISVIQEKRHPTIKIKTKFHWAKLRRRVFHYKEYSSS
jgi:hypothetical protein